MNISGKYQTLTIKRRKRMPDYIDTMMYVGEIPWHKQGTMVHEAPRFKMGSKKSTYLFRNK